MFNSFIDLDTNSYEKKEELLTLSESLFEPGWCRLLSFFAQTRLKEIPALEAFKFIPQTFIDSLRSVLQKQMYQRRLDGNNKNDLIDLLIGLNDQDQDKKVNSGMKTLKYCKINPTKKEMKKQSLYWRFEITGDFRFRFYLFEW